MNLIINREEPLCIDDGRYWAESPPPGDLGWRCRPPNAPLPLAAFRSDQAPDDRNIYRILQFSQDSPQTYYILLRLRRAETEFRGRLVGAWGK